MWPGGRYWLWNVLVWAFFAVWHVLGYGVSLWSLEGLAFWSSGWFILSAALWLVLFVGEQEPRTVSAWLWFSLWVVLGLAAAVAALVLGPLLFLPAAAVAGVLAYLHGIRRSAYGLLSGIGALLLLYVTWLAEHYAPHLPPGYVPNHAHFIPPFLLGVVLFLSGLVAQGWSRIQRPVSGLGMPRSLTRDRWPLEL